ncbi:DUF2147 domain-containing protein [Aquimarina litoralis]|uniref:DUF2147 domain-containing protein n=1 Tax=Aquimarina litoralis TaxID=584605 RepID=UPI001C562746|nr:DUF2147 domain-containing protein [Aquimarina litoralis]MBW1296577.1 DUF2147 domain-containing protein [Aquimarina litoralis]
MKLSQIIIASFILLTGIVNAQDGIIGKWKTIDDNTGEARSIVEIYKKGNQIYGKIDRILKEADRGQLCTECEGEDYNKPIEGMVIIKGLEKDGDEYEDGTILDPENGKVYKCKIWLEEDDPNTLNVRGYIAFLFRTQQWIKA